MKTVPHPRAGVDFRRDISGLRAIAVLVVLLFHMGMHDWPGGFVGVDVFFVISGYLILPRLNDALSEGRFDFFSFIAKRIRRLVPALLPVLVYSLLAGMLLFGSGAFADLLDSIWAASVFASNIYFALTLGYFTPASDLMLLLHTWSLGVEFQFYLLAPLVLAVAGRWRVACLAALSLLSFAISVQLVDQGSNSAYYGLESRFWQLGLGGLVGIAEPRVSQRLKGFHWASLGALLRTAGLGAIFVAATQYTGRTPFPGFAALLPTLGACLVIGAPKPGWDPVAWLLSSRFFNWIGERSYSIYLWHWPLLLTLENALVLGEINDGKLIGAALLSIFFAHLSYRYVEVPVQRLPVWRGARRAVSLAVMPVIVFMALWAFERGGGALSAARAVMPLEGIRDIRGIADPARHAYKEQMDQIGMNGENGLCSLDFYATVEDAAVCLQSISKPADTLVIGDSHGRDIFLTLQRAFPSQGFHMLHQSACAPAPYRRCFPGLLDTLPDIVTEGGYARVIIGSQWAPASLEPFADTARTLALSGISTVILGGGPVYERDIGLILSESYLSGVNVHEAQYIPAAFRFDIAASDRALRDIAARSNIGFVPRLPILCPNGRCLTYVPGTDNLMYFDNQHLTLEAMEYLAEKLRTDPILRHELG